MRRKINIANKFVFIGLLSVAILILGLSIYSEKTAQISDSRILGVHQVVLPTPFYGCKADGSAVSSASECCNGKAVYVWSTYVCGDVKPVSTATPAPKVSVDCVYDNDCSGACARCMSGRCFSGCNGVPTINIKPTLVPTMKPLTCEAGIIDAVCTNANGQKCQWYRDTDCHWTCDRNCEVAKHCTAGNLGISCVNSSGQNCQKYQNSDCSIDCTQNCKDKDTGISTKTTTSTDANTNIFKSISNFGSCRAGTDYNRDGIINSLDVAFCKGNTSGVVKTFSTFINQVNEGIPQWLDWITSKLGWYK